MLMLLSLLLLLSLSEALAAGTAFFTFIHIISLVVLVKLIVHYCDAIYHCFNHRYYPFYLSLIIILSLFLCLHVFCIATAVDNLLQEEISAETNI